MQFRDPDSVESGVPEAPEAVTVPLPPPSAGPPLCAVVALSDDPLLLEALGGAAGDSSSVSSSPSTDRFIDQLVANGGSIALIDAACVPAPLKNFLITMREQFPQLLLLVTGTAQLQAQLSAQIADGTVFRFVHKPASSQRLRLFLDAAMRQQAVQAMPSIRPGPPRAPIAPAGAVRRPAARGRHGLGIGIVAGAVLAALAGWWIWQHRAESVPASEPAAAVESPALSPEPAPPAAAPPQAQEPAADASVAHDNPARDAALEQAQRNAQGARADQLAVYLQLVRKRLASGALIDPADDSARTYLDSALALAPDNPEVRATSLAFGEALIAKFRSAIAAADVGEAQHWLTACNNFHVGGSTMSQLSAQLQQLQSAQQIAGAASAPGVGARTNSTPRTNTSGRHRRHSRRHSRRHARHSARHHRVAWRQCGLPACSGERSSQTRGDFERACGGANRGTGEHGGDGRSPGTGGCHHRRGDRHGDRRGNGSTRHHQRIAPDAGLVRDTQLPEGRARKRHGRLGRARVYGDARRQGHRRHRHRFRTQTCVRQCCQLRAGAQPL